MAKQLIKFKVRNSQSCEMYVGSSFLSNVRLRASSFSAGKRVKSIFIAQKDKREVSDRIAATSGFKLLRLLPITGCVETLRGQRNRQR